MKIIAHRGASGHVTENTMAAFDRAREIGCEMIELDVHVCKTGELAVYHDFSLELDGSRQQIGSLDKEVLGNIELAGNQRIPFLDEVLDKYADKMTINIELKGEATFLPAAKMLEQFKSRGKLVKTPVISSLKYSELENFSEQTGNYPLGWVIESFTEDILNRSDDLKLNSIHPSLEITSRELISGCHDRGLRVYVFTVNEKKDFENLLNMGADGIFTDYPERFL